MSMMVGARNTQSSAINVTPPIDVLLVLLIIFMVVLPEHKVGREDFNPTAERGEDGEESSIPNCHAIKRRW